MTFDTEDVKAVLDIAANSMDAGSGFLDNAEVEAMRRVAVALGVDPIEVTPSNFTKQYPHDFKVYPQFPENDRCMRCSLPAAADIHHTEREPTT